MPPMMVAPADAWLDPQPALHKQSPAPAEGPTTATSVAHARPFYQRPSAQDRAGHFTPRNQGKAADASIMANAQGQWKGTGVPPIMPSPVDYGRVPNKIPRLWKDGNRSWAGLSFHGDATVGLITHVNQWLWIPHLRPAMPTRGFRSISGVLQRQGPTASTARVPAVFVPSQVA